MTPQQILDGMRQKNRELSTAVDESIELGEVKAQAEREYKKRYAVRLLELRSEGVPMAIIKETAQGDKMVSELKHAWDVAEILYNANREKIKCKHANIETYRSVLSWNKLEYRDGK